MFDEPASDRPDRARAAFRRARLLFLQREQPRGGAAAVAAWMIQSLIRDYDVTLLRWRQPDLREIDRFFGTSLQGSGLKIITIEPVLRRIIELDPDRGSIQDWCVLLRRCKQIRHRYDLLLSAEMEADFGEPGIQYIHFPAISSFYPPRASASGLPWWRKGAALIRGELRPWMILANYSFERMRRNVTLTNSDWVGDLVRKTYGIETVTLYPPAAGGFRRMPWAQRENGFVCIGRIDPCKRIEWIVELLDRVRTEIPEVRLHIVGPSDIMPGSHAYRRKLAELFRSNADWVELHENLPREELLELLARNRYGIHAHTDEHFGIAVAEMVLAGCIPFVYDRGGPVEIVGGDSRLLYSSADDAMEKIVRTMTDRSQQENVLTKLAARAQLFSAERFMREVRGIVERALAARQVANPAQPSSIRPQS